MCQIGNGNTELLTILKKQYWKNQREMSDHIQISYQKSHEKIGDFVYRLKELQDNAIETHSNIRRWKSLLHKFVEGMFKDTLVCGPQDQEKKKRSWKNALINEKEWLIFSPHFSKIFIS